MTEFMKQFIERRGRYDTLLCLGQDPDDSKILEYDSIDRKYQFNKAILEKVESHCVAIKPNFGFYVSQGADGINSLINSSNAAEKLSFMKSILPSILDWKIGDIGNTCNQYLEFAQEYFTAHTANPYMGQEAVKPLLDSCMMNFFIVRTSNPGSDEFQCQELKNGQKLWEYIAESIAYNWNGNNNCGMVFGATNPEEIKRVRDLVGFKIPLLIPGLGAQGGDVEKSVKYAGENAIFNSSRAIIYADDPELEADRTKNEINQYRG